MSTSELIIGILIVLLVFVFVSYNFYQYVTKPAETLYGMSPITRVADRYESAQRARMLREYDANARGNYAFARSHSGTY